MRARAIRDVITFHHVSGLCYFDFELVIQVGVFLYVLSLVRSRIQPS